MRPQLYPLRGRQEGERGSKSRSEPALSHRKYPPPKPFRDCFLPSRSCCYQGNEEPWALCFCLWSPWREVICGAFPSLGRKQEVLAGGGAPYSYLEIISALLMPFFNFSGGPRPQEPVPQPRLWWTWFQGQAHFMAHPLSGRAV